MLIEKVFGAESEERNETLYGGRGGRLGAEVVLPGYEGTDFKFKDSTPANIFNSLIPYIYVVAGIILLFLIVMGGIGMMTAAGNPDKIKAAQGKITAGLIGFLVIFISYFVAQILELVLGIKLI